MTTGFKELDHPKSNQLIHVGFLSMLSFRLSLHVARRAHSSHGDTSSCWEVLRDVPIMVQSVGDQGTTRFRQVLSTEFWSGAGQGVA